VRRITLSVGLALLMATFVVASALPAIAAPPDVDYECTAQMAIIYRPLTGAPTFLGCHHGGVRKDYVVLTLALCGRRHSDG
jgi:hypothetical protein